MEKTEAKERPEEVDYEKYVVRRHCDITNSRH